MQHIQEALANAGITQEKLAQDEKLMAKWILTVEQETCNRLGIKHEDWQMVKILVEQDRMFQIRFKLEVAQ
jgi:hypothetical protein